TTRRAIHSDTSSPRLSVPRNSSPVTWPSRVPNSFPLGHVAVSFSFSPSTTPSSLSLLRAPVSFTPSVLSSARMESVSSPKLIKVKRQEPAISAAAQEKHEPSANDSNSFFIVQESKHRQPRPRGILDPPGSAASRRRVVLKGF